MAVHNLPNELFIIAFDEWARPITVTYQSGGTQSGRGYFSTYDAEIISEAETVYSDQTTILDILNEEFPKVPDTGDTVDIPADPISGNPALGSYQITDVDLYDANQLVTKFTLRKVDTNKP